MVYYKYKFNVSYNWGHMKSLLLLALLSSAQGSYKGSAQGSDFVGSRATDTAHLQRIARERNITIALIQERIELMNVQIKDIERCHEQNTCKFPYIYEHGRLRLDRDALKVALEKIGE